MHRLLVVLALVVVGCGDDGDSAATGGNGKLRSDIIEVFPPSDQIQIVSDADVDGDRIVIVTISNIQYVYFHVSNDRGKTWESYFLDDALGTDIYWDAGQVGVHLQDGKIFFLLSREYSPRTTEWGLYEVALVPRTAGLGGTMELTEITPSAILHPMAFHQKRPDGHMRGMLTLGYEVPIVNELDAVTGNITGAQPPCTGAACRTLIWYSGNGGDSFHGYSQSNVGTDMCRLTWHETAGTKQACVRPHQWFVPYYSHNQHVVVTEEDEPYLVWSQDNEAYAIGITDAGALTPVHPLGPGLIENFAISRLGRARFGGFELVYPLVADEGHLVRMTSHGPEQVNFRETPCTDVHCGYTGQPNFGLNEVSYILPTGRGDYYVFYVVQSASTGTLQALYMSPSETPTFTAIEASGPLPGPPTFTPPAGASPMTPMQEACMAAAACSPVEPDQSYLSCLRQFTVETPEHPYLAAARARLIAAAPGGCAAIAQAWPQLVPGTVGCSPQCSKDGGTCAPGSAVCSIASPGSQCRTCSDASTYIDCDGPEVLAVACPTGTTCSAGVGCVLTAGCPSSDYCDGSELVSCALATSAPTTTDCVGRGGTCGASLTCESTQTGAACNSFQEKALCDGPYLTLCAADHRVFTDCRAIGHATCTTGLGGARCSD